MPCTGKVWSKENPHRNAGEKVSYITTLENAISAEVHFPQILYPSNFITG